MKPREIIKILKENINKHDLGWWARDIFSEFFKKDFEDKYLHNLLLVDYHDTTYTGEFLSIYSYNSDRDLYYFFLTSYYCSCGPERGEDDILDSVILFPTLESLFLYISIEYPSFYFILDTIEERKEKDTIQIDRFNIIYILNNKLKPELDKEKMNIVYPIFQNGISQYKLASQELVGHVFQYL